MKTYYKTTDVQRTWLRHGWSKTSSTNRSLAESWGLKGWNPPSEDPEVQAKWNLFKTLNTEAQKT
jgi:hypothetical protein